MSEHIVNMNDGAVVEPGDRLTGAWLGFVLRTLAAGEAEALQATEVEHLVYVVSGAGTASVGGATMPFGAGSAFTIVRGDAVRFEASELAHLFVATLRA